MAKVDLQAASGARNAAHQRGYGPYGNGQIVYAAVGLVIGLATAALAMVLAMAPTSIGASLARHQETLADISESAEQLSFVRKNLHLASLNGVNAGRGAASIPFVRYSGRLGRVVPGQRLALGQPDGVMFDVDVVAVEAIRPSFGLVAAAIDNKNSATSPDAFAPNASASNVPEGRQPFNVGEMAAASSRLQLLLVTGRLSSLDKDGPEVRFILAAGSPQSQQSSATPADGGEALSRNGLSADPLPEAAFGGKRGFAERPL